MKHWFAAPAALIVLASAGSALAENPAARNQAEGRILYICDNTAAVREAFAKEFGEVKFVTADEAQKTKGAWSAPRCITPAEHARLEAAKQVAQITRIKG